jgi:superfamily II RNA helicase
MDQEDLLPAIVFIFSRAACDDAVRQCRKDGLRFTDRDQARRIRDIAYDRVADFRDEDLTALAFEEFLDSLMVGLAAHHAGMVPAFREIVEQCFEENLLGAVFATETLALGINMPARSVVLERMSKYSDAGRAMLNTSEFLQMTGRAGRRGLDDEGHVVVCFAPETSMLDIGRLAVADPPDLHSSFRPTYNLTVNLLHHFDQATALDLIQRSFAQFEANLRPAGARRPLGDLLEARRSVLEALGYARGWSLSEGGQQLRSLYHENDLLLAEAWRSGVFEGCEPATLAAVLSAFVYEGRRRNTTGPVKATKRPKQKSVNDRLGPQRRLDIAERLQVLHSLHARVSEAENAFHVKHAKDPDGGLAAAMAAWARGATLHVTLDVADAELGFLAPGDFVRHAKQVGDLAEQIGRLDGGREWQSITQETRAAVVRSIVLGATEIRS